MRREDLVATFVRGLPSSWCGTSSWMPDAKRRAVFRAPWQGLRTCRLRGQSTSTAPLRVRPTTETPPWSTESMIRERSAFAAPLRSEFSTSELVILAPSLTVERTTEEFDTVDASLTTLASITERPRILAVPFSTEPLITRAGPLTLTVPHMAESAET